MNRSEAERKGKLINESESTRKIESDAHRDDEGRQKMRTHTQTDYEVGKRLKFIAFAKYTMCIKATATHRDTQLMRNEIKLFQGFHFQFDCLCDVDSSSDCEPSSTDYFQPEWFFSGAMRRLFDVFSFCLCLWLLFRAIFIAICF